MTRVMNGNQMLMARSFTASSSTADKDQQTAKLTPRINDDLLWFFVIRLRNKKPTVHDVRRLIKSLRPGCVPVDSLDSSPEALTVKAVSVDIEMVNEMGDVPWSLVNKKLTCQLRAFELIGREVALVFSGYTFSQSCKLCLWFCQRTFDSWNRTCRHQDHKIHFNCFGSTCPQRSALLDSKTFSIAKPLFSLENLPSLLHRRRCYCTHYAFII